MGDVRDPRTLADLSLVDLAGINQCLGESWRQVHRDRSLPLRAPRARISGPPTECECLSFGDGGQTNTAKFSSSRSRDELPCGPGAHGRISQFSPRLRGRPSTSMRPVCARLGTIFWMNASHPWLSSVAKIVCHRSEERVMPRMTTAVRLVSVLTGFLLTVSRVGATDIPISIESLATDHYVGVLPTLPTGTVVFGGVTFDLPSTRPLWTSNGAFSIPPDLIATQTVSAAGVQAVHLLLNTGNTYASQMSVGQQIGSVILDFSTGDASVTPLLVGVNIRDAAPGTTAQPVIGTITDPNVQQVWSG